MDNLTPQMQARLDRWRKNILPVKSAEKIRGPWQSKSRNVSRDHGDDLSDFEEAKNRVSQFLEEKGIKIYKDFYG
jgi:hypothetical protein